jgi:DNA-binding NtrC family response regulator
MIRPTILIIDKDKNNTSLITSILDNRYETLFSYTSNHGLKQFKDLCMKIRIVLLRAEISDANSIDILNQMKKISNTPKIILFSDHKTIETAVTAMKAGAFDYIGIPFNRKILLRALDTAIEQSLSSKNIEDYSSNEITKQSFFKNENEQYETRHNPSQNEILSLIEQNKTNNNAPSNNLESLDKKTNQDKKQASILIVEDEDIYRKMLCSFLNPKYITHQAANSITCHQILQNNPNINLILLDIFLPDTPGLSLLEEIKKLYPKIDIIIITAYQLVDIAVQALKLGACDYLNKPVLKVTLLDTIANALYKKNIQETQPSYNKHILEKNLSDPAKIAILTELTEKRITLNKSLLMEDIYTLFPQLRETYIPGGLAIPKKIIDQGLISFIEDLKSKIKNFNPLANEQ